MPVSADMRPGEVEIYRIDLARLDANPSCLTDDERARAAQFHFAPDRARFVACRISLRHILAKTLGVPPAEVRFTLGAHGKPAIARDHNQGDWQFNLSHSGDIALIAVTQRRSIGIDIEVLRPVPRQMMEILPSLSPAEQTALQLVDAPARSTAFLRCWTRKEAVIKALGAGLTIDLASFTVSVGTVAGTVIWQPVAPPGLCQLSLLALDQPCAAPTPFIAALAVGGAIGPVRVEDFQPT